MIRSDESLHGDRAQVGDDEIGPPLQAFGRLGIERDAEAAGLAREAEKHSFGDRRERARLSARNSGSGPFAVRRITTSSPPIANVPARRVGRAGGEKGSSLRRSATRARMLAV